MLIKDARVVAWLMALLVLYCTVLVSVIADLWSGVRKARELGTLRTSEGYKRTVLKLGRYYNTMMGLTVVDIIYVALAYILDVYYQWELPMLPFVSALGAVYIAFVEVKSIYEKADEKERRRMREVATLATEIAKQRADPVEIAKAVAEYLSRDTEAIDKEKSAGLSRADG